jgi:quinol monooxygenase YgiN
VAHPGRRDELVALLIGEETAMDGCRSFVVARDPKDPDALWITEVWDSEAQWAASLDLPAVKASIEQAMPLICSFGEPVATEPVGGIGL